VADWNRSDQHPESSLELDPVVADPFMFAPVLVAGEVWPLLVAEMPVEGLVLQEGRPLTPSGLLPWGAWDPLGGLPEIVEPAPTPVGVPAAGPVALGLAALRVGLPGVAALIVGVVVMVAPPVAPTVAPVGSVADASPALPSSATAVSTENRYVIRRMF
jgi:hypothetical protein